jgi:hypothetical protein
MLKHTASRIITVVATLGVAGAALGDEVTRANWVPTHDFSSILGDMWTFKCPTSGTVDISVQRMDDTREFFSNIDPIMHLVDGIGTDLFTGDDDVVCAVPGPFGCPSTLGPILCGAKNPHSLIIHTMGTGGAGGGGYILSIEAFDRKGVSVAERRLKLGGEKQRKLPVWADPAKGNSQGPALNDEGVPF